MGKLFDIHIEVGIEKTFYYSRTDVGGFVCGALANTPSDAVKRCVQDMHHYGMFMSLKKDPSYANWPLPSKPGNLQQPVFTLHFEYGEERSIVQHYWKTVFAPTNPKYGHRYFEKKDGKTYINTLLCNLVDDLVNSVIFGELLTNPSVSIYPFPSPTSSPSAGATTSKPVARAVLVEELDKKIVPQLPSQITDIPHPQCQNHCTAWVHFKKSRCASMCSWRKEI